MSEFTTSIPSLIFITIFNYIFFLDDEEDLKTLAMMRSPNMKNVNDGTIGVDVIGPFRNELHNEQVYIVVMKNKKTGNIDSPFIWVRM